MTYLFGLNIAYQCFVTITQLTVVNLIQFRTCINYTEGEIME